MIAKLIENWAKVVKGEGVDTVHSVASTEDKISLFRECERLGIEKVEHINKNKKTGEETLLVDKAGLPKKFVLTDSVVNKDDMIRAINQKKKEQSLSAGSSEGSVKTDTDTCSYQMLFI